MYPILDLAEYIEDRPEALGTKEKFWLLPRVEGLLHRRPHLFKIGRENTGENWAEKLSCEIAKAIELPCASYEFAEFGGRRGVITESFVPSTGTLILGNLLLSRRLDAYDGAKTWDQLDYKLSTVFQILKGLPLRPPIMVDACVYGMTGVDYFVGYLVFDCLIGNTDRHHENWGVIINNLGDRVDLHLSPSFDHASCLGRNELDARREFRLSTKDKRASVEAYAAKAKSAFYPSAQGGGTLRMPALMAELVEAFPEQTRLWSERIASLTDGQLDAMLARIHAGWMSDPARAFAFRMLRSNRQMIREVGCA